MSNGNISLSDLQRLLTVRCKNDNGSTLKEGACVRWTDDDAIKVKAFNGSVIDHFAGILNRTLADDQEESTALVTEGKVKARFLGHASAAAETWAVPVPGQSYLTYSPVPTGIRLLTDMTGDTSVHEADESGAASVYIYPGAMKGMLYWTGPAANDDDYVVVSADMKVGTHTVAQATLGVARNLVVKSTATDGADTQGTVAIVGTDINGDAITETITPVTGSTVQGTEAFKTITSVTQAGWVTNGGADKITVGFGDKLGLPRCLVGGVAEKPLQTLLNNTVETTAPTVTADIDEVEKNLIDLNSALDGNPVTVFFPFN